MLNWLYLTIAIVAEVIATFNLKNSENFTKLYPSLIVVAGYLCAFYFLSLSLRTVPLAVAYAVWSGAGVALIAILGWIYYGQKLEIPTIIGLALIICGITLLKINSK